MSRKLCANSRIKKFDLEITSFDAGQLILKMWIFVLKCCFAYLIGLGGWLRKPHVGNNNLSGILRRRNSSRCSAHLATIFPINLKIFIQVVCFVCLTLMILNLDIINKTRSCTKTRAWNPKTRDKKIHLRQFFKANIQHVLVYHLSKNSKISIL